MIFAVQGFSFWLEKDTHAHSLRAEEEEACCEGSQLTGLGIQYRLFDRVVTILQSLGVV